MTCLRFGITPIIRDKLDLITLQQIEGDASTLVRTRKPACLARRLYGLGEGLVMCSNLGRKRRDRRRHPPDHMPTWRVKWWWYPIPLISIGVGSQVGRKVMVWNSMQRRKAKEKRQ